MIGKLKRTTIQLLTMIMIATTSVAALANDGEQWSWLFGTDYGFQLRLPFQLVPVPKEDILSKEDPVVWQRVEPENEEIIYNVMLHYIAQPNHMSPREVIMSVFEERLNNNLLNNSRKTILQNTVRDHSGTLQIYECNAEGCIAQQLSVSFYNQKGVMITMTADRENLSRFNVLGEWDVIEDNMRWIR